MLAIFPAFLAAAYGGAHFAIVIEFPVSERTFAGIAEVKEESAFWERKLAGWAFFLWRIGMSFTILLS